MSFTPLQDRVAEKGQEPSKLWIVLRWTGDLSLAALCLYVAFNSHNLLLSLPIPVLALIRFANGPKFAGISLICCGVWLAFHLSDASPHGRLRICESNIEQIHVAIERYADRHHEPPKTLDLLIPDYISGIPACPNHAQDQYSGAYRCEPNGHYSICCMNSHLEAGVPPFHPRYSSSKGLQQR